MPNSADQQMDDNQKFITEVFKRIVQVVPFEEVAICWVGELYPDTVTKIFSSGAQHTDDQIPEAIVVEVQLIPFELVSTTAELPTATNKFKAGDQHTEYQLLSAPLA
ncbi:hypothetical protein CH357_15055 [Leptospira hartskeerlii]|uniref:Uncharacterized protein n=1 Tax=Leptospira hartskeerlii TaxID=2023177 RepID=A0A2M9X9P2_9LEPT|nr:hypothetical protein CH357_15055 [Leptospira hartskeerlii]